MDSNQLQREVTSAVVDLVDVVERRELEPPETDDVISQEVKMLCEDVLASVTIMADYIEDISRGSPVTSEENAFNEILSIVSAAANESPIIKSTVPTFHIGAHSEEVPGWKPRYGQDPFSHRLATTTATLLPGANPTAFSGCSRFSPDSCATSSLGHFEDHSDGLLPEPKQTTAVRNLEQPFHDARNGINSTPRTLQSTNQMCERKPDFVIRVFGIENNSVQVLVVPKSGPFQQQAFCMPSGGLPLSNGVPASSGGNQCDLAHGESLTNLPQVIDLDLTSCASVPMPSPPDYDSVAFDPNSPTEAAPGASPPPRPASSGLESMDWAPPSHDSLPSNTRIDYLSDPDGLLLSDLTSPELGLVTELLGDPNLSLARLNSADSIMSATAIETPGVPTAGAYAPPQQFSTYSPFDPESTTPNDGSFSQSATTSYADEDRPSTSASAFTESAPTYGTAQSQNSKRYNMRKRDAAAQTTGRICRCGLLEPLTSQETVRRDGSNPGLGRLMRPGKPDNFARYRSHRLSTTSSMDEKNEGRLPDAAHTEDGGSHSRPRTRFSGSGGQPTPFNPRPNAPGCGKKISSYTPPLAMSLPIFAKKSSRSHTVKLEPPINPSAAKKSGSKGQGTVKRSNGGSKDWKKAEKQSKLGQQGEKSARRGPGRPRKVKVTDAVSGAVAGSSSMSVPSDRPSGTGRKKRLALVLTPLSLKASDFDFTRFFNQPEGQGTSGNEEVRGDLEELPPVSADSAPEAAEPDGTEDVKPFGDTGPQQDPTGKEPDRETTEAIGGEDAKPAFGVETQDPVGKESAPGLELGDSEDAKPTFGTDSFSLDLAGKEPDAASVDPGASDEAKPAGGSKRRGIPGTDTDPGVVEQGASGGASAGGLKHQDTDPGMVDAGGSEVKTAGGMTLRKRKRVNKDAECGCCQMPLPKEPKLESE